MNSYNPFSLSGKTIMISGASSGIGKQTAIECSKMGANVILLGRNIEKLNDTAKKIENFSGQIFAGDIEDDQYIEFICNSINKINGFVNSAGHNILKPFEYLTKEIINKMVNINYIAPIELTRNLLKKDILVKNSSIVFISALASLYGTRGNSAYAASKGAINSMANVMALELSKKKIRVNCILPGMVRTPMIRDNQITEEELQVDEFKYPLGYGDPVDIAMACVYFLSDASKWVTGCKFIIDGGVSIN